MKLIPLHEATLVEGITIVRAFGRRFRYRGKHHSFGRLEVEIVSGPPRDVVWKTVPEEAVEGVED